MSFRTKKKRAHLEIKLLELRSELKKNSTHIRRRHQKSNSQQRDWRHDDHDHDHDHLFLFTTCTNPIIHLFYPPPPPQKKKKKFCIGIVFDFSWDIFMAQENLQTMVMQKSWKVIKVYYGIVQVVNTVRFWSKLV